MNGCDRATRPPTEREEKVEADKSAFRMAAEAFVRSDADPEAWREVCRAAGRLKGRLGR